MRRFYPAFLTTGFVLAISIGCESPTQVTTEKPTVATDTSGAPEAAADDLGETAAEEKAAEVEAEDQNTADKQAEEESVGEEKYVPPEEIVRAAFAPPPGASALTRNSNLWIDRKQQRVYLDGYVTMKRGPLEMFACPIGTKEHESIVATLAKAREVHAALLAIEAMPGTPVQYVPEFVPATGQIIRVWVCWRDPQKKFHVIDARKWIQQNGTEKEMQAEWVFAGSRFWTDPSDGREYYQADSGDMICVSNFSTALMDVNISSSAEADQLQFVPYEERIPEIGTPIRLILVPVPNPTDDPDAKPKFDPNKLPTDDVLPPADDAAPPVATSKSDESE